MQNRRSKEICCYCGVRIANTKDHIPPKAIFNKPRPSDLITVPSCRECNEKASSLDEKFKAYLGLHVAKSGGIGEKLFKEGVIPTIKHNAKLRTSIFRNMKSVYLKSKGIIIGKGKTVLWDSEAHDLTIDRIIRGLFYYHYHTIMSKNVSIQTYWFKQSPIDFGANLYVNSIANGAFIYLYNRVEGTEYDSMWLFQFYGNHWAGGIAYSQNKSSS